MLSISKELFTAWNNAGLSYCHWKSNEHLLPGLEGNTDLDVLLSRDGKEQGEVILRKLDFVQCKSQYGSRYPGVDDWIGFDKDTGKLIHLHLHYHLVTGHKGLKEYSLPWSELALQSRILNDDFGVYTMEPNLELVTLITRIGLKASFIEIIRCKRGKFKLGNDTQREIDWLKERVEFEKVQHLLTNYYGNSSCIIQDILKKDTINANDYLELRKVTESTFRNDRRIKNFIRFREISFFIFHRYIKKIINKIHPIITKKVPVSGAGTTFAFLGQDGAGKTTVTQELIKWWSWKMDVRYVYLGSGENYYSLKKNISQKIPPVGVFKYLRAILGLSVLKDVAKQSYRNVIEAEKYAKKGGLVIFDRYPQNEHFNICDGPKIRNKIQKYFGSSCLSQLFVPLANKEERWVNKTVAHAPNVVIKLLLSPEESIRRKPYENYESIKQKHEIIKSLRFDNSDVYTIDATMPYEEEMVMIKNIIWQHIHK